MTEATTTEFVPVRVTGEQVINTLREVVAEKPDYVYAAPAHQLVDPDPAAAACFYVHTDPETGEPTGPGCIVGHVFHRLGVPLAELSKWENRQVGAILGRVVEITGPKHYIASSMLGIAQQNQDGTALFNNQRQPWSKCLERAEAII